MLSSWFQIYDNLFWIHIVTHKCDRAMMVHPSILYGYVTLTPYSAVSYPQCKGHWRCKNDQFCGTKCWTGECGNDGKTPANTPGNFCQPCKQCVDSRDSSSGSCKICPPKQAQGHEPTKQYRFSNRHSGLGFGDFTT